jgi:hypothetical protein
MEGTYTSTNADGPTLNLEELLRVYKELQESLPVLLYRTSEYAPLVNAKGEPALAAIPEVTLSLDIFGELEHTGRQIIVVHPDNLPVLRTRAAGYRLVEWQPEEPTP